MKTTLLYILASAAALGAQAPATDTIPFRSHDGQELIGKLTRPASPGPHAVVIYVQTAEGMTIDMKRPNGRGGTFNYFDLYADTLPAMNVAFFRYEGRGIRLGDAPPRYEQIDWDIYNTSTLENKVRDVLSAVQLASEQKGIDRTRIFLMGASEGTLLAAAAAARAPDAVAGLVLYGAMSGTMRETFRYIMTDGGFLAYRGFFDTDRDGRISKAEFEADPQRYRERVFRNAGFENFDKDGDGDFTAADMRVLTRPYLDAIDNDNFAVLDAWAKNAAGVATPANWFRDHFAQAPIWTHLSRLRIPIGFFHGALDTATPIEGVREIEAQASATGMSNMKFHYFDTLDHSLNISRYFVRGTLPEGHAAIFAWLREVTAAQSPRSR